MCVFLCGELRHGASGSPLRRKAIFQSARSRKMVFYAASYGPLEFLDAHAKHGLKIALALHLTF